MNDFDYRFKRWNPNKYLKDYFSDNPTFESTIKFLAQQSKRLPNNLDIIDIGCGPTACYWSVLSKNSRAITLADYKKSNLNEIKKWVLNLKDAFSWNHYSKLAIKYLRDPNLTVNTYENRARKKVTDYIKCNLFNSNPLKNKFKKFDLVSTFYCADSISKNSKQWFEAMNNIKSLIKSNGILIGGAMNKCKFYKIGNLRYPCANISKKDILIYLKHSGFKNIVIQILPEYYSDKMEGKIMRKQRNYEGLILFYATLS